MYSGKPEHVYNRHQRKSLNKNFRDILNNTRRNIEELRNDPDDLAKQMVTAFEKIELISNPSLDEKFDFLKVVAPNWGKDL